MNGVTVLSVKYKTFVHAAGLLLVDDIDVPLDLPSVRRNNKITLITTINYLCKTMLQTVATCICFSGFSIVFQTRCAKLLAVR